MSEQPYTYADIVVGTKKFIKPEEKNTTGDDTQSTDTEEKTKKKDTVSKTDSNNVKKSTTGSKSQSATVGDASEGAPEFIPNGYDTSIYSEDEDGNATAELTENEMNEILNAKTQYQNDSFNYQANQFFLPRRTNSLDKYVSVNYLWTLAALSNDEYNFPHETYKKKGPRVEQTVIKMGGFPGAVSSPTGPMPARPMTELELKNGGYNTEYFIDNVEINSIVAPNPKSRITTAFNIEFEVTEPYSMGQFLQHLQLTAMKAGYTNYLECPYLLQLDVIGYRDSGTYGNYGTYSRKEASRQFAMKIYDISFDVSGSGSRYQVLGIPFNEEALTDQNQSIPSNISISGRTIQEICQTGVNSLASVVNTNKLVTSLEAESKYEPDEIIILFPNEIAKSQMGRDLPDVDNSALMGDLKDRRDYDVDAALESVENSYTSMYDFLEGQRGGRGMKLDAIKKNFLDNRLGFSVKRNNLSEKIKTDFMTADFTNKIGKTAMFTEGALQAGTANFGLSNFAYNEKAKLLHRGATVIDPNKRTIQFKGGTKIQRIIEELVLISDFGKGLLNKGQLAADKFGMVDWFRIEVQTYVLDAPQTEGKLNRYPKIFVYNVVPARIHQSVFMMPNDPPPGYEYLKKQAVKEYDYIYTGKNTDILNFDISFKQAFFTSIANDFMNRNASNQTSEVGKKLTVVPVSSKDSSNITSENTKTVRMANIINDTQVGEQTRGAVQESPAVRVARAFQDALINSPADLISADMTILGDLYFLHDSGAGNYFSSDTPYININADGSMNHTNGQVDIIINFRTPFDIDTGSPTAKGLSDVEQFSGLYQVISVTNSFRGNVFTNELNLVRRLNQYAKESYDNATKIKEQIFAIKKRRQAAIDAAIAAEDPEALAVALADLNGSGPPPELRELAEYKKYLQMTKADFAQFKMRQADYEINKKKTDLNQAGRIRGGI